MSHTHRLDYFTAAIFFGIIQIHHLSTSLVLTGAAAVPTQLFQSVCNNSTALLYRKQLVRYKVIPSLFN